MAPAKCLAFTKLACGGVSSCCCCLECESVSAALTGPMCTPAIGWVWLAALLLAGCPVGRWPAKALSCTAGLPMAWPVLVPIVGAACSPVPEQARQHTLAPQINFDRSCLSPCDRWKKQLEEHKTREFARAQWLQLHGASVVAKCLPLSWCRELWLNSCLQDCCQAQASDA